MTRNSSETSFGGVFGHGSVTAPPQKVHAQGPKDSPVWAGQQPPSFKLFAFGTICRDVGFTHEIIHWPLLIAMFLYWPETFGVSICYRETSC